MAASPRQPTTGSSAASANRFIAGVNVINGTIDNKQYANIGGYKGALLSSSLDKSKNTSVYAENSFYFLPTVAAIGGTQFLYATRDREARFGSVSGSTEFNLWSPKAGLLWDIDPTWQAFANVSRSAEVPSFGESATGPGIPTIPFTSIQPQRATTYEIGTRGRRPRPDLGADGLPRQHQRRTALPLQRVRQLQRHKRRQDLSSRHRSRSRRGDVQEHLREGRGCRQDLAQSRLHSERFPLR